MSKRKRKKQQFSPANLSVSQDYVYPGSRKSMVLLGCIVGLGFLAHYAFDALVLQNSFVSSGVVSSSHANFETACRSCHEAGNDVSDALCSSCHEKTSAFPVYDFKAHYLYRSHDFERLAKTALQKHEDQEMRCSACHVEHRGRAADISPVSDKKCLACHEFGSFNEHHPEFEFVRKSAPDDSTLLMTHLRHTVFVLQEMKGIEGLDELFQTLKAETMDMSHFFELACLHCHNPDADGTNFRNLSFDRHCAGCHVKASAVVLGLPKFDPQKPGTPGVETIEQMQQRGGPGTAWTFTTSANLVSDDNGEVTKAPVWHKDPWIMENLKQIRQKVFAGDGLFELLRTSGDVPKSRIDTLYSEAVHSLQTYADELQIRGGLQRELGKINKLLNSARRRLQAPSAQRTGEVFAFPSGRPNPALSEAQRAGFLQLAAELTSVDGPECRRCHIVEQASFRRVQADQRVLIRAEFNHRAHILEKRCTECHSEIPLDEEKLKLAVTQASEFEKRFPEVLAADRAATQNIPNLSSCQECHTGASVSNRCITCHNFHPNKQHRSGYRLFVQQVRE